MKYENFSKLALLLEFFCQLPYTVNELSLGNRHSNIQHTLRHPALVVTVHQPHKLAHILILSNRSHHLTARAIHSPDNFAGCWSILELHTLASHHKYFSLVAFLGGIDKVPGGHHSTTPFTCHLIGNCTAVT